MLTPQWAQALVLRGGRMRSAKAKYFIYFAAFSGIVTILVVSIALSLFAETCTSTQEGKIDQCTVSNGKHGTWQQVNIALATVCAVSVVSFVIGIAWFLQSMRGALDVPSTPSRRWIVVIVGFVFVLLSTWGVVNFFALRDENSFGGCKSYPASYAVPWQVITLVTALLAQEEVAGPGAS